LRENKDVASVQYWKRPTIPSDASLDKVSRLVKARLPKPPVRPEVSDSDGDVAFTPATTTKVDSREPLGVTLPKGVALNADRLAVHDTTPIVPIPAPVDVGGCVLLGKKRCKADLKPYCSDDLAERLVSLDKISRVPWEFVKTKAWLRDKAARKGGKLHKDDVKSEHMLSMGNGRSSFQDFKAIWESSGPDSDSYDYSKS
jgi:hypothetical protein